LGDIKKERNYPSRIIEIKLKTSPFLPTKAVRRTL